MRDPSIEEALSWLRKGRGPVAFPTETVYGLGAPALSPRAVERVFELKGRPRRNPLIVHVRDLAMARTLTSDLPREAERLAERFWPGPLTLVLARGEGIPDIVTGGGPTIAIRVPAHPLALELLEAYGAPLVGPSANPSGRISPTRAEHVRVSFSPTEVYVIDGGPCTRGIESTVLRLGVKNELLRPGPISVAELEETLGARVVVRSEHDGEGEGALPSPGLLRSHYAPRARASLLDEVALRLALAAQPKAGVVIGLTLTEVQAPHQLIEMPRDAEGYARALYGALREADDTDPSHIWIEAPPREPGLWLAIHERLARATAET